MAMLYTDRPATEYWRHFVDPRRPHDAAEVYSSADRLPQNALLLRWALVHYLAYEHGEQVREEAVRKAIENPKLARWRKWLQDLESSTSTIVDVLAELSEISKLASGDEQSGALAKLFTQVQDIGHPDPRGELEKVRSFALRDWAAEPYGAGNHAWKPGVRWWDLLRTLASFGLRGRERIHNLHVCGEAYSDWHGFIEGALGSAASAIKDICNSASCRRKIYETAATS